MRENKKSFQILSLVLQLEKGDVIFIILNNIKYHEMNLFIDKVINGLATKCYKLSNILLNLFFYVKLH